MSPTTAGLIVSLMFGVLIAVLLGLILILGGEHYRRAGRWPPQPGDVPLPPTRAQIYLYFTMIGLMVILIVVVRIAPLRFNWLAFPVATLGTFAVVTWIYIRARSGHIRVN